MQFLRFRYFKRVVQSMQKLIQENWWERQNWSMWADLQFQSQSTGVDRVSVSGRSHRLTAPKSVHRSCRTQVSHDELLLSCWSVPAPPSWAGCPSPRGRGQLAQRAGQLLRSYQVGRSQTLSPPLRLLGCTVECKCVTKRCCLKQLYAFPGPAFSQFEIRIQVFCQCAKSWPKLYGVEYKKIHFFLYYIHLL